MPPWQILNAHRVRDSSSQCSFTSKSYIGVEALWSPGGQPSCRRTTSCMLRKISPPPPPPPFFPTIGVVYNTYRIVNYWYIISKKSTRTTINIAVLDSMYVQYLRGGVGVRASAGGIQMFLQPWSIAVDSIVLHKIRYSYYTATILYLQGIWSPWADELDKFTAYPTPPHKKKEDIFIESHRSSPPTVNHQQYLY